MADIFARQKAIWLKHASEDLRLNAQAFRTAYVLSGYFNRTTGNAWPSQKTLAAHLGVTKNGLKNSIRRLAVMEGGTLKGMVSLGDLAVEGGGERALDDISAAPTNN